MKDKHERVNIGIFIALSRGLPDLPILTSAADSFDGEDERDDLAPLEMEMEVEASIAAAAAAEQSRSHHQPDNTGNFDSKDEDEDHEQRSHSSSKSVSHHHHLLCSSSLKSCPP